MDTSTLLSEIERHCQAAKDEARKRRLEVTANTTPYAAGSLDGRILAYDEMVRLCDTLSARCRPLAESDPVI